LRTPFPVPLAIGRLVRIDESNQYLGYDPSPNWAKTLTTCTDITLAENVVPERSLAVPTDGSDANLLCG
jgi:hypothetical protein